MEETKHLDVEILEKRKEKLKKKHDTLETPIEMESGLVEFERCLIEDLELSIMLPIEFDLMPADVEVMKYPSSFRPLCIYTSPDYLINLNFTHSPTEAVDSALIDTTHTLKEIMERSMETSDFGKIKSFKKIKGYYFDFNQQAMDGQLYHLWATTQINNQVYQLTFNCPFSKHESWESIVLQMWESIEPEEAQENERR